MPFRSRNDSFTLYGRRRSGWRVPRWLVLLLLGMASGAAGLWWVQERHLPPRLGMQASQQLLQSQSRAEAEATRLAAELTQARTALAAAVNADTGLPVTASATDGSVKTPASGNGKGINVKVDATATQVHVLL